MDRRPPWPGQAWSTGHGFMMYGQQNAQAPQRNPESAYGHPQLHYYQQLIRGGAQVQPRLDLQKHKTPSPLHSTAEKPVQPKQEEYWMRCSLCNLSFSSENSYIKHSKGMLHTSKLTGMRMNESSKEQGQKEEEEESDDDDDDDDDDEGRCKACDVEFKSRNSYLMHIRGISHHNKVSEAAAKKKAKKNNAKQNTLSSVEPVKQAKQLDAVSQSSKPIAPRTGLHSGQAQQHNHKSTGRSSSDQPVDKGNSKASTGQQKQLATWQEKESPNVGKEGQKDEEKDSDDDNDDESWCKACNVEFKNRNSYLMHIRGISHHNNVSEAAAKKKAKLDNVKNSSQGSSELTAQPKQSSAVTRGSNFSASQTGSYGAQVRQNVDKITAPKPHTTAEIDDGNDQFESRKYCQVCQIQFKGVGAYMLHMRGISHFSKVAEVEEEKHGNRYAGRYTGSHDTAYTSGHTRSSHEESEIYQHGKHDILSRLQTSGYGSSDRARSMERGDKYVFDYAFKGEGPSGLHTQKLSGRDQKIATEESGTEENWKFCEVCQLSFDTYRAFLMHTKGLSHVTKVEAAGKNERMAYKEENQYWRKDEMRQNFFHCKLCDMSFSEEQALKSHVEGSFHKRKDLIRRGLVQEDAEGLKHKISGNEDDSYGFDDDEPQSKRQREEDYEEEQPTILSEFHCNICAVTCSGMKNYTDHLKGNKHKKKLKHLGVKDASNIKKPEDLEELLALSIPTTETNIQKIIDKCEHEPLLGLDYVSEHHFASRTLECRYFCELCDSKMDPRMFISHVTGLKHRRRYMKYHHTPLWGELCNAVTNKKVQGATLGKTLAQKVEAMEGRYSVRLRVEVTDERKKKNKDDPTVLHWEDGTAWEEMELPDTRVRPISALPGIRAEDEEDEVKLVVVKKSKTGGPKQWTNITRPDGEEPFQQKMRKSDELDFLSSHNRRRFPPDARPDHERMEFLRTLHPYDDFYGDIDHLRSRHSYYDHRPDVRYWDEDRLSRELFYRDFHREQYRDHERGYPTRDDLDGVRDHPKQEVNPPPIDRSKMGTLVGQPVSYCSEDSSLERTDQVPQQSSLDNKGKELLQNMVKKYGTGNVDDILRNMSTEELNNLLGSTKRKELSHTATRHQESSEAVSGVLKNQEAAFFQSISQFDSNQHTQQATIPRGQTLQSHSSATVPQRTDQVSQQSSLDNKGKALLQSMVQKYGTGNVDDILGNMSTEELQNLLGSINKKKESSHITTRHQESSEAVSRVLQNQEAAFYQSISQFDSNQHAQQATVPRGQMPQSNISAPLPQRNVPPKAVKLTNSSEQARQLARLGGLKAHSTSPATVAQGHVPHNNKGKSLTDSSQQARQLAMHRGLTGPSPSTTTGAQSHALHLNTQQAQHLALLGAQRAQTVNPLIMPTQMALAQSQAHERVMLQDHPAQAAQRSQLPGMVNMQAQSMIANLAECVVGTEMDAEIALKVSNSLTKALLQYRLEKLSKEGGDHQVVKDKMRKISDHISRLGTSQEQATPTYTQAPPLTITPRASTVGAGQMAAFAKSWGRDDAGNPELAIPNSAEPSKKLAFTWKKYSGK